jgi:hypothetical protein
MQPIWWQAENDNRHPTDPTYLTHLTYLTYGSHRTGACGQQTGLS